MGRRIAGAGASGSKESVKDLKPQLGRTEALAKDLKQQVEILAANYKEIAEVLRGV